MTTQRSARCCSRRSLKQVHAQAVGQAHVGDDARQNAVAPSNSRACARSPDPDDLVALAQQGQFVQRAQIRLVVDDEDMNIVHGWPALSLGSTFCRCPGRAPPGKADAELVAGDRRRLHTALDAVQSRSSHRGPRTIPGRYTGPDRWNGFPKKRTARTDGARPMAPWARHRSRPPARHGRRRSRWSQPGSPPTWLLHSGRHCRAD